MGDLTRFAMRRIHWVAGWSTVAAFLASGAYLRWAMPGRHPGPEDHLLFISRHIYLLGPALVHLVLATYFEPVAQRRVLRLQWAGTVLLTLTSVSLMSAFLVEPIAGHGRTALSTLGLFSFWAGAFLHVLAPAVSRVWPQRGSG